MLFSVVIIVKLVLPHVGINGVRVFGFISCLLYSLLLLLIAKKDKVFSSITAFKLPGRVPQHIIQRGNNREACFFEEQDYQVKNQ